ncbi:MAG: DUF3592 domain-containing protein [Anaerolineales bacterium]|nr:DUF3592 domain-containing protein [Anaerolineales bacterium]
MKISKVSIFISLICFAVAGFLYIRELQFLSRAETVSGRVKTFQLSDNVDGGMTYCPLIEFTTDRGETVVFNTLVCSNPAPYEPGEEVTIFYDPLDPTNAQVDEFWSKYTGPFAIGVSGLVILLVAWIQARVSFFVQKITGKRSAT